MAKPIYSKFVQTSAGAADPSASFTVVNEETGLDVDIYSDRAGTTVITPPYFADSSGLIRFYYDEGITIRIAVTGASGSFTDRYQEGRVFGGEPGNSPRILDFQVDSISQLPPATGSGRKVSVTGYHSGWAVTGDGLPKGGDVFVDAGLARHNGGTFIDPNRSFPTDWSNQTQVDAWYADSGVDVQCWASTATQKRASLFGLNKSIPLSSAAIQSAFDSLTDSESLIIDEDFTNEDNFLISNKSNIKIYFESYFVSNCRTVMAFDSCENITLYSPRGEFSDVKNTANNFGAIPAGWKNFGIVFYTCQEPRLYDPEIELNQVLPVSAVGGYGFNCIGGHINGGGDNSVYSYNCRGSVIMTTSKNTAKGRAITVHRSYGHKIIGTIEGGAGIGIACVGASNTDIIATCKDIAFDGSITFNRAAVSVEGNENADVTTAELDAADADPSLINNAYSRNVTVSVTAHNCGDGCLVGLGPRGNNGSVIVTPHVTDGSNGVKAVDARGLTVTGGKIARMSEAGVRIQSPALGNISDLKVSGVQFEDVDGGGAGYNSIHRDGGITSTADSVIIEANTYNQDSRRCNIPTDEATFINDWPNDPEFTVYQNGNRYEIAASGIGLTASASFQDIFDLTPYLNGNSIVTVKLSMGETDRRPIRFATLDYNRLTDTVYNKNIDPDTTEDITIAAGVLQVKVPNSAVLGYGSQWRANITVIK